MAEKGIAAVGECMLELSGRQGQTWTMGFAGDTLNTLWAMKALAGGRAASYVSAFGDDPFSRDQIAFLQSHGIGIGASPVIAGARPGIYAIALEGAERSFTYWRGDSAARQLASDPDRLRQSLRRPGEPRPEPPPLRPLRRQHPEGRRSSKSSATGACTRPRPAARRSATP